MMTALRFAMVRRIDEKTARNIGEHFFRGDEGGYSDGMIGRAISMVAALGALALAVPAGGQEQLVVTGEPEPCPFDASDYRGSTEPVTCQCAREDTEGGDIWGTRIYAEDSRICRAAVHAGGITRLGGRVRIEILPGRERYRGSESRGLTSRSAYAYDASYRFLFAYDDSGPVSRCPDTARQIAFGVDLACRCLALDGDDGAVWGTYVYTDASRICRAAIHSGVLGREGGLILVRREAGRESYSGSERHGIASQDYGRWDGSFRILAGEGNF